MALVCHAILQDHVINASYNPIDFGGHRKSGSEDIII